MFFFPRTNSYNAINKEPREKIENKSGKDSANEDEMAHDSRGIYHDFKGQVEELFVNK